ncbi:alpha-1,3-mannosyl-glycoprotein 4-beta-N-acetylglucosaminyltransferase-like protein MGAT4E isoform X1 [Erinaceus europaeus]|uniref:Alpha-1,3-mannosyl-glycoprotein 4-beta-N-acetylglucosaminyltransferase-like protein MGAT4E isoform X1 n=1 Tax=Erinaceus europaeus TaxID=9365 RepID=A0ABM3WDD0_ERIEU|nr:alpha-1,3-mannosyl-glycoprotein 4-beta-N-acetylglucosaminyltransferase-like protein MGAT4E isoform X1 [Erinaceus europaeus]
MQPGLWQYISGAVALVFLSFFIQENSEKHPDDNLSLQEEKKKIVWQLDQERISLDIKNHLETFRDMQTKPPLFQQVNYTFLSGSSPPKKKLLTVGISSVQHPSGNYLLETLTSLFNASSEAELSCIVVLVHLSDPDPQRLTRVVANISSLFKEQIEAQRLLVIQAHCLQGGQNNNLSSPCEALYSRQNVNYGLLMNLAMNLSEYFLLLQDNVHCAPEFVSTMYWTLLAWKELPWVMLEFSSLSFSGKVFHTSDLHRLASFFLLFHKDSPGHILLSQFHLLMAQNVPIRFSPSVFYHIGSYPVLEGTCFPVEEEPVFGEPDNPVADVLTDMMTTGHSYAEYAYFLNDEGFSTLDALRGNYLTVIFEKPHKVIRIEVLTGTDDGEYRMQHGQVEVGYDPFENSMGCTRYNFLGPLMEGHLDQRVFYEEDAVQELSCIRLVVLESQESWLLIKQIKVWTQNEEEKA